MPTTITGNDGVSQVQTGSIQSDDLASGVGGVGTEIVPKTTSTNVSEVDIDLSGANYGRVFVAIFDLQPVDDGADFNVRTSTDGGSTVASSSAYSYVAARTGGNSQTSNSTADQIELTHNPPGNENQQEGARGFIEIIAPRDASSLTSIHSQLGLKNPNGTAILNNASGYRLVAEDNNTIRIYMAFGDIASITYEVWGYVE